MSKSENQNYYYANQEQVVLETDDEYLAFDMDEIKKPTRDFKAFVKEHAESLRGSVYLVAVDELTDEAQKIIEESSSKRPVYRSGENMVIVLPEIRVNDDDENLASKLDTWLEEHGELAQANKDKRGRMIIEPKNKTGNDTLEIARSLIEDLKIESAQPRTVQKIRSPRPGKK